MGNVVGSMFGGGGDAAESAKDAAEIQAKYQREALEYLKDTDAMPRQYREGALGTMADLYGLGSDQQGMRAQQQMIDRVMASPMYQQSLAQGEQSIMRNQAMTGGLRSGDTQSNLANFSGNLLGQGYNQQLKGLQGMAGLPSLAPSIAGGTAGIGQTLAAGEMGGAQAQQAGGQMGMNNMMGLGQLGMMGYGMSMMA